MTIEQAKQDLLLTLDSIDKEKLSLPDLKLYAETLRIVAEIQGKSYVELLAETLKSNSGFDFRPAAISDLK